MSGWGAGWLAGNEPAATGAPGAIGATGPAGRPRLSHGRWIVEHRVLKLS